MLIRRFLQTHKYVDVVFPFPLFHKNWAQIQKVSHSNAGTEFFHIPPTYKLLNPAKWQSNKDDE